VLVVVFISNKRRHEHALDGIDTIWCPESVGKRFPALEFGFTLGDIGADTDTSVFQEDLDPATKTDPLKADTDGDRWQDDREDANHNGRVDPGERDPNVFNAPGMLWLPLLLAPKPEGRLSVWFEPNPVPLYTGNNPCYSGVNEWLYTA